MNDSSQTPVLSGRELARARRREMSHTGGAKTNAGRSNPRTSNRATAPAATPVVASAAQTSASPQVAAPQAILTATVETTATDNGTKALTGKALSMARRATLAKTGSNTLPASANPARKKPGSSEANSATPVKAESKLDESASSPADTDSATPSNTHTEHTAEQPVSNADLDTLCEIIESSQEASANASSSVRAFCRDRRNTLSKQGKLGLPGKAGRQARKSLVRGAATSSLTGKALAKLHREDRCVSGRGDIAACRPSGRVRPGASDAPAKVEIGTTLSGQSVSGTQVEQTDKITGSEAGGCRAITGTEYLGVEQFANLCSTIPRPAEAAPGRKTNVSETTHGQLMTGTNVAASNATGSANKSSKVTGTEAGDCKAITGSEYLGTEHFKSVCSTNAGASLSVARSQQKVIEGITGKNMRITGADEARDNAVTGSESGSAQNVTGSDYINMQQRSQSAVAPAKVGFSHTAAGLPVSGGESSRTSGITGDEQDACGRVTGTEYVSSERFVSTCGTAPAHGSIKATTPAKVGVDASRGGMTITGNLVDRDNKVTGNEPGTCQRVTGSQYDSSANKGFCSQRSSKVHEMHTLHGRPLTGTEGSPSPKLTGDDRGSCSVVTGNEYVSQEYFQQSCPQTPQPSTAMTGLSQTWNNQVISGAQTGHSQKMTGDEQGICKTVTGSSYAGRELTSEFCVATAVAQGEQRMHQQKDVPALPVSGMTPAMDERMAGNFQRGTCQSVTGTPYQGQQDRALCNSGNQHHLAQASIAQNLTQPAAEPYSADFTVMSPAKAAWQQRDNEPDFSRVHSSVYARRSSITGAVNKAEGVISGTPEFRHQRDIQPVVSDSASDMTTAQPESQKERITGEGSESGTHITGDDWSRGGMVTGTEGLFSASRNQTQQGGASVKRDNIGAYALRGRERPEVAISKVTGGSGNTCTTGLVTLSGGASA
jgi:hypothetical protein